jgi:two-component sensor histidine kinase
MDNPEAEELRQALEDLHAVQRESDHRVKNNLQLVSSLLQLQGRRAADPAVREALKATQARMSAVSAAHRHVSRDDGHEWVQADGMVRDVVGDLAVGAGRDDIVFELRIEPLRIAARDGAPLALIANELVGNAIRHGCPTAPCRVEIELSRTAEGYRLVVCDDGPDGVTVEGRPGVGLTICQLLAQQLRGALQIAPPQPGRRVVLSAPLAPQTAQAAE